MATTEVDALSSTAPAGASQPGPPRAVLATISEVAERDGVSRQAVSKTVKSLVERHGLEVERDAAGRIAAINVVQYDMLRGKFSDPSKAQASSGRRTTPDHRVADAESYDEALRLKTWRQAEQARLALDKELGRLIKVDDLARALDETAGEILQIIERLPNLADDLAAAVAREGAHGARVLLRANARKMREDIAQALKALAESKAGGR